MEGPTSAADIRQLRAYVTRLLALRRRYPALRRRYPALRKAQWYLSSAQHAEQQAGEQAGQHDVDWLNAKGDAMQAQDWEHKDSYCIAIHLHHEAGENCLLLCNAEAQAVEFTLPPGQWRVVLDSSLTQQGPATAAASSITTAARSMILAVRGSICPTTPL